jgi:hypothetical protein
MAEKEARPPVVMYFQPDSYKQFRTPDELKQWERMMREHVGFKADISNLSGTCTECSCGGNTDDCDQD